METEGRLVERLRGSDAIAPEVLIKRYASRVHRLAYGITGNEADAEEVAQDVFVCLFRKIHTFEGRAALGSWIYRIAANAALIKRRGKRAEVEELLSHEARTILNRAINEPPDHYRAALVLRDVEGLSNEEAAEALGASVASMKSRVHRARLWLRDQLTADPDNLQIQTAGCGRR